MTHPEMEFELDKIYSALQKPDFVNRSNTDTSVKLFYKRYLQSSLGNKFLCVLVKNLKIDFFIITAYFIDKIKKVAALWQKK